MEHTVLVIGSGGREHALAYKLAQSPNVKQVYIAPGNGGTTWPAKAGLAAAGNVAISANDFPHLIHFAQEYHVDLTVVGPEAPLAAGIVDAFSAAGLRIFGPSQQAAQLESSKAYAKAIMLDCGIPTAQYAAFEDYEAARAFLTTFNRPVVIKADGLAAGKGVIVCDTVDEADAALRHLLVERPFGPACNTVVIEERLSGPELSLLAFTDGKTVVPMLTARDHKRIGDGDTGPNTGGMGAYAPVPEVTLAQVDDICRTILQPLITEMASRGTPYVGVLYAGLMQTMSGFKVLEFNCRFGDPETQVILPLLDSDLYEILSACVEGRLDQSLVRWRSGACATVVVASPGYPGVYPTALPISVNLAATDDSIVFHMGTTYSDHQLLTTGGRVLAVTARGDDLPTALETAYGTVADIHFDGMHYRRDIGRALEPAK